MLTLISPAKINLFLQILHKRSDGYHELASLFQAISLHDTLTFKLSSSDILTCSDPKVPVDSSNLISKALGLFRIKTGLKFHVSIHLEKKIPMQAGLGGGSSNAATTLFALNELLNVKLSLSDLKTLGSELGSDVPFFFSEGSAYCTGRGEIIENLKGLPKTDLWIVKPPQGLSTPLIFKNLQPSDMSKKDPTNVLNNFLNAKPDYFNDLEIPSFKVLPSLKTLKSDLENLKFDTVLMSGSGSSFFCIGDAKSIETESLTTNYQTSFISRDKNNWYQCEKHLQKNNTF